MRSLFMIAVLFAFGAVATSAQPPEPVDLPGWTTPDDTTKADTTSVPDDTSAIPPDSTLIPLESDTVVVGDTIAVSDDTLVSTPDTVVIAAPVGDISDPEIAKYWSVREVAPNVYAALAATAGKGKTHAGFVVNNSGVVVIDAGGSFGAARALRRAVRAVSGLPITHVVLTNAQPERVLGVQWLLRDGAELVVSEESVELLETEYSVWLTVQRQKIGIQIRRARVQTQKQMLGALKAELDSAIVPTPTLVVTGDGVIGSVEVIALPGATVGDMVVYVPTAHVLFTGDLVTPGVVRLVESAVWPDWIESVKRLRELDLDVVVGGTGPVAESSALKDYERYLTKLYEEVKKRVEGGMSVEDTIEDVLRKMRDFDDWRDYATRMEDNIAEVYRALSER
jgi:glyoxylase-like metal-dependent hydrolase (beta-lactamase superfamily II)